MTSAKGDKIMAAIIMFGVFASIVIFAAMSPGNRRLPNENYDDDEYWGI